MVKKSMPARTDMCDAMNSLPGRVLAPFRRRCNAVSPQDVSDRPVRHAISEVRQRSHDPIVPSPGVLASHLNHQRLNLSVDS